MWVARLPDSGAAVLWHAKEQLFYELSLPQQATSSLCAAFYITTMRQLTSRQVSNGDITPAITESSFHHFKK